MIKLLMLFTAFLLAPLTIVYSQTLMDYVSEVKGDTLVIKDYYEMNNQPNSLSNVLLLDSVNVPTGRVYELKVNGYYPISKNPTTRRNIVIVGEDNTIIVNNKNVTSRPPIICGTSVEEGGIANTGGILFAHDLIVKNCIIIPGTQDGAIGMTFFDGQADNIKLSLQNCLLEQTRWVFMITRKKNISWHIKDCYFVNMNDNFTRRSGGVMHIFAPQDTLLVENSTHIMAQGYLYRFWSYPFKRIIFNHNTFINCAHVIFQDYGSQCAMSVTSNIFVNCNVKPYVGIDHTIDPGEEDIDQLPVGIVNIYPDSAINIDRKYLVSNNLIFWDPKLAEIVNDLNKNNVNESTNWVSQMITMNQRTQSMFDDDANYPYLKEGVWFSELPNFTDTRDLLTTQIDNIKSYVSQILDTTNAGIALSDWRLLSTNIVLPDWPIPIDLSYSNPDLAVAGIGRFPVGDLNWFPLKKANWITQRNTEYAIIQESLDNRPIIIDVIDKKRTPFEFNLQQNYPNPFNPVTVISYQLSVFSHATLKIYDLLGNEVATLVNEQQQPGNYQMKFDGSNLSSGIYFYKLTAGNFTSTKKLILIK